jgi:hypothetical protein
MVCSVIFSQKLALVTRMPEPPNAMAGESNKMAAEMLSSEQRKIN